jgi:hypothetical protein
VPVIVPKLYRYEGKLLCVFCATNLILLSDPDKLELIQPDQLGPMVICSSCETLFMKDKFGNYAPLVLMVKAKDEDSETRDN